MYPAVSHTFILREVLALRQRRIQIEVASINAPSNSDSLTQEEQLEAADTFFVKRVGAAGALRVAARIAVRHPLRFARGLGLAWTLSGLDLSRLKRYAFYWVEALILMKWMADRSLDHVHVHFATPASTVALILAGMAPVTFSVTVHGPDEFYDVHGYNLAEKVAASRFVVCISFFARSQMMKLADGRNWPKFDLARLGVDCSHFSPATRREMPEPFEILCVGRLISTKGQRILIEAIAQLIEDRRRVRLRLIGDGPDRKYLESLVAERKLSGQISFEGSINQERIRAFYAAADIFALASFAEGIPVVLMEAMAMEIPCVASNINGIPELIRDGIDGLLVAPSDVQGLCAALSRLMDERALRESIGKAGRLRVEEHYNLSRSADRMAAIFRRRLEFAD
jgi:glycosyltransferase involved in cell wall biosynthesis